ncbi:MAG: Npun_F0494 family protein [Nostochopsis sp.]
MSAVDAQNQKTLTYPPKTIERAKRSLLCCPFDFGLFAAMLSERVAMSEIVGNSGINKGYTKASLSELRADNALAWLIQVGVLRREVDGQGITDSFRLTPLGRQIVEEWEHQPLPTVTWGDRILDIVARCLRLPF